MKKLLAILILFLGFQIKVQAATNYESYTLAQLLTEIKNDIPEAAKLYYNKLTTDQKMHYDGIVQSYLSGKLECDYSYIAARGSNDELEATVSDINKAYEAFLYEHKEFFFIGTYSTSGYKTLPPLHDQVEYKLNISMAEDYYIQYDPNDSSNRIIDTAKVKNHFVEILNKRDQVHAHVSTLSNDYEKIKYIHDYLVLNNSYQKTNTLSYTPAGALVDSETPVCEAYSEAFQMLAHHNNLVVAYATGMAFNGTTTEAHAWNHVKLGTSWYLIDVTWDDPLGMPENHIGDNYFLIPKPNEATRSYDEQSIIPTPFTTQKYSEKPAYNISITITGPDGTTRNENQFVLSGDDVDFTFLQEEGYDLVVTGNHENITNNGSITITYTIKTFTIRFYNGYDLIKSETINYNETPVAQKIKKDKYVFKGWNPEIKPAKANQNYEAVWEFKPTLSNPFDINNPIMMITVISVGGFIGLIAITILFRLLFRRKQ